MSPRWRVVEILADGTRRWSANQGEAKARELFAKIHPVPDAHWRSEMTTQVQLQCHMTADCTGLKHKYWSTVEAKL